MLLIAGLFALASQAQTISSTVVDDPGYLKHTLNWALREKTEFSDGDNVIQVENTGNNLFQTGYTARLNTEKHGIILHKFDASGKEIVTNKLENGERKFGPIPTIPLEYNKRIFLLYFRYDDKDSMKLYISEIDKNTLNLVNTKFIFSYQQDNVGILKMSKALGHQVFFRLSPDSSKLLLAYQNPKNELVSGVFDRELKMLRRNVTKNMIPEEADLTDAFVENSGNSELILSVANNSFSTNPLKGIIIQRLDGTEKYHELSSNGSEGMLLNCHLKNAKDNSKVYLFGDYSGDVGSAGIWMAELESDKQRISRTSVSPYPDDYKENIYKIGFGVKKKGSYGILDVDYQLVEFDNGTFALCGNPVSRQDNTYIENGKSKGYIMYFSGPIMVAFIEKNKAVKKYSMIPRNENMSLGSEGIYIPYQDKLVIFYNDYRKNIESPLMPDDVRKSGGSVIHEMSLAYAVMNKNGDIPERKLVVEGVSRMNCFNTGRCRFLDTNKLAIPSVSLDKKTDAYKVALITIN